MVAVLLSSVLYLQPIGEHYKIVTVEKSENPQNTMVIYTKLDQECRIQEKSGVPQFDFYWLMDGARYKPTNRLIQSAIRKRLRVEKVADGRHPSAFKISTKKSEVFGPEVASSKLIVSSQKTTDGCKVSSILDSMQVDTFNGVSRKTFKPPFRKLKSVTVKSTDLKTGAAVQRKFELN